MSQDAWFRFAYMRVLLLQGPHGPFFTRVAAQLKAAWVEKIFKINFNGGDVFYSPKSEVTNIDYRGAMSEWPEYIDRFLLDHQIDCVIIFGDCRPIHEAAGKAAHAHGLHFWVFEEGYVRPNFITFEPHGVNGKSHLPTERSTYEYWQPLPLPIQEQVNNSFWLAAGYSFVYYLAALLMRWYFPKYQHHRRISYIDAFCWIRSLERKWRYAWTERKLLADINEDTVQQKRQYFICVLQVSSDAQVQKYSNFQSIEQYICDVVVSFYKHAPNDTVLLIKHHPMDRAYTDYSHLIKSLVRTYGLGDRLRYIHDQHLPTLMNHALGLVTINSTVGLSAMDHALPVKALGRAIYNLPGLTSQRSLDEFWLNAHLDKPEPELHQHFVNYVISHTQINGNFYRPLLQGDVSGVIFKRAPQTQPSPLFMALPTLSRVRAQHGRVNTASGGSERSLSSSER